MIRHRRALATAIVVLLAGVSGCGSATEPTAPLDAPAARPLGWEPSTAATSAPVVVGPDLPASAGASEGITDPEGAFADEDAVVGTPPTTIDPACIDSYDTRCGSLRFSPEPQNLPLSAVVRFSPEHPRAGETVTITVVATDGDAVPVVCTDPVFDSYTLDDPPSRSCGPPLADPQPRGWWSPPPPTGATRTFTYTYVYDQGGNSADHDIAHTFKLTVRSYTEGWAAHPDPYESKVIATGTVYVSPTLPAPLPWL